MKKATREVWKDLECGTALTSPRLWHWDVFIHQEAPWSSRLPELSFEFHHANMIEGVVGHMTKLLLKSLSFPCRPGGLEMDLVSDGPRPQPMTQLHSETIQELP